jgi:hypothetical protein
MNLATPIPILRSFDEKIAKEFYVGFLEFNVDFEHRFEENTPLYMQISKGNCVIHISEHFGDCSPGSALRVEIDDIEYFCKILNEKKYKNARPGIIDQDWGKDMTINDPFGNKIIFSTLNKN